MEKKFLLPKLTFREFLLALGMLLMALIAIYTIYVSQDKINDSVLAVDSYYKDRCVCNVGTMMWNNTEVIKYDLPSFNQDSSRTS